MYARKASLCPGCGQLINVGDTIRKPPGGRYFTCLSCAARTSDHGAGTYKPAPVTGTWADAMYQQLGIQLADAAHKALTRVLHPDGGGDHERMTELNAARDRAHGRNTKGS